MQSWSRLIHAAIMRMPSAQIQSIRVNLSKISPSGMDAAKAELWRVGRDLRGTDRTAPNWGQHRIKLYQFIDWLSIKLLWEYFRPGYQHSMRQTVSSAKAINGGQFIIRCNMRDSATLDRTAHSDGVIRTEHQVHTKRPLKKDPSSLHPFFLTRVPEWEQGGSEKNSRGCRLIKAGAGEWKTRQNHSRRSFKRPMDLAPARSASCDGLQTSLPDSGFQWQMTHTPTRVRWAKIWGALNTEQSPGSSPNIGWLTQRV